MDTDWLLALSSTVLSFTVVVVVVLLYVGLGRQEAALKAGRKRSGDRFGRTRERADAQYAEVKERTEDRCQELRERSDAQHREQLERHGELREWAEGQFREVRERSDAQHAETLAEIRRLTDALVSHSHTDGGIIFHIPPPSGQQREE